MDNLTVKLLSEISNQAGMFNSNNIFQFCIENDCDIATVTNCVNKLIDERKIVKRYYCPYEERFANEPIGKDSYETFSLKLEKITKENINELMIGLDLDL